MAIKVSENGRLFTLQTKDSSYQMFADDKIVLLHLYYGVKIGEENLSGLIFCTDMGFAGNPEEAGPNRKYSLDALPQEIPGSGVGDFRDDMIEIRHADGIESLYAHLSALKVCVGDRVERGQVVALSGATGKVTGPHLHFQLYEDGLLFDPEPVLRALEEED